MAEVWSGGNLGAAVNVAIVDDGIHAGHVDLTDNVDATRNHDYTGNDAALTPPHAHGTQLAGIVAARGNALGVRGVAPSQARGLRVQPGAEPHACEHGGRHHPRDGHDGRVPQRLGSCGRSRAGFCRRAVGSGRRVGHLLGLRRQWGLVRLPRRQRGAAGGPRQPQRVRQPPRRHRRLRGERRGRAGRLLGARRQPVGMRAIGRYFPGRAPGSRNDGTLRPLHPGGWRDGGGSSGRGRGGGAGPQGQPGPEVAGRQAHPGGLSTEKNHPTNQSWSAGAFKYGSTSERYNFNRSLRLRVGGRDGRPRRTWRWAGPRRRRCER